MGRECSRHQLPKPASQQASKPASQQGVCCCCRGHTCAQRMILMSDRQKRPCLNRVIRTEIGTEEHRQLGRHRGA
jgi:hypothetical protein